MHGWKPEVLLTPLPLGHDSHAFGAKFLTLIKYLKTLPGWENVLVTDAYDVLFLESPQVFEEKLTKIQKKPVLFSAELFEGPDKHTGYNSTSKHWFKYLNSGAYVGTAAAILALLVPFTKLSEKEQLAIDDQRYYTVMYHETDFLQLDHAAEIFVSMNGLTEQDALITSNNKLILKNGNMPSVAHFQGFHKNILPYVSRLLPGLVHYAQAIHKGKRSDFDRALVNASDALIWLGKQVDAYDYADHGRRHFYVGLAIALLAVTIIAVIKFL